MKSLIVILAFFASAQAMALSNKDLCNDKVKAIAARVSGFQVKSADFEGDLAGIQQLDGVYDIMFSSGGTAELRLSQQCTVVAYQLK